MAPPPAHAAGATAPERALVRAINQVRHENGLAAVRLTPRLDRAARSHTRDMLRHGRLTHDGGDGTRAARRLRRLGYGGVGETLAWFPRGTDAGAAAVLRAWLDSPPHRRQILEPRYRRIGVARLRGSMHSQRGVAVTVDLSTPR